MIRASLVVGSETLKNDRIFSDDPNRMRDNISRPFKLLRDRLKKLNVNLATEDINPPEDAAIAIALNIQKVSPVYQCRGVKYTIITEPPCIVPDNWNSDNYCDFKRVFIYNETFIDGKKTFLLRFPGNYGYGPVSEPPIVEKKFCTLIAGFKTSNHPNELYSERLRAIKWFAENHPKEFDLYGVGWPRSFRPKFHRYVERILSTSKLTKIVDYFFRDNQVYRGKVLSKRETLSKYKFSICFENCVGEHGYITEKLFDSMGAGCVPVYCGAVDIASLVPDNCYINMNLFSGYHELYNYLSRIDETCMLEYQEKMKYFLSSGVAANFTPEFWAKTIASFVHQDLFD